jgi:hypothetical protein
MSASHARGKIKITKGSTCEPQQQKASLKTTSLLIYLMMMNSQTLFFLVTFPVPLLWTRSSHPGRNLCLLIA